MTDTIPREKQKVNILVGRHYFEILHWPDAHRNEDGKASSRMLTFLQIVGWHSLDFLGLFFKKSHNAALVQRLSIPACHAGDVSSILICCSK